MSLLQNLLNAFADKKSDTKSVNFSQDSNPVVIIKRQPRKVVKKSARITKVNNEEILPVKISGDDITIHIIPVSPEDQQKKRVRGYKYLTV